MRLVAWTLPLLLSLAPALGQDAATQPSTSRWYEIQRNGDKVGYSNVAWAPSTWEGNKTVHDTTTVLRSSTRNMSGVKNIFSSTVKIDLERNLDGTLWLERYEVQEGARTMVTEIVWTGAGYRYTSAVVGGEEQHTIEIPLDEPVMTDAESFVGYKLRAGTLSEGDMLELPLLDVTNRGVRISEIVIGPREEVDDAGGVKVQATRITERDPESGAESSMWLDDAGAFVQIRGEGGTFYQRVTQEQAEEMPVEPAEYSVTSAASPTLERIFTADKVKIDLFIQGDEHRKAPEFPDSPWSRVVGVRGDDAQGWVYELELLKHDVPDADASFPADAERFSRELEPTVLMPCDHPDLQATAKQVVGAEPSMRQAAYKLARYVYKSLDKRSPDVGEATALEILRSKEGDCSEHATLFVALCRAAGIPARRCSGYVCLGRVWGGHAWAEIWVGEWIAADPTTGEVAPGARYLFYGYHDVPGSFPGVVSARASGRMRLVSTYVEEDGQGWDLRETANHRLHQPEEGRYVHVLAGLELEGVPRDWEVSLVGDNSITINAPDGLSAWMRASADQGATLEMFGGATAEVAGVPAVDLGSRGSQLVYYIHVDRQLVQLVITNPENESRAVLDDVLARAFGTAPEEPASPVWGGDAGGRSPGWEGPVSPGWAIREVVDLKRGDELVGLWSLTVLETYWKRVAAGERVALLARAAERAGRLAGNTEGLAQKSRLALEAWRARTARRVATAQAELRDPEWLNGRDLSARWVPAADLPAVLELHVDHVGAARASARAQRLLYDSLERSISLDDPASVRELVGAAETTTVEELAEVEARLSARLAHDKALLEQGGLLSRYGLD